MQKERKQIKFPTYIISLIQVSSAGGCSVRFWTTVRHKTAKDYLQEASDSFIIFLRVSEVQQQSSHSVSFSLLIAVILYAR